MMKFNFGLLVFTILLASCQKNKESQVKPLKPLVTERGTTTGTPVSKTIGAAGGTLTSMDGKLTINIPAGAINNNTEFTIQPVSNTLEPAMRDRAYRLLPESVNFAKEIEITFHYNEDDFKNTIEDGLFVAYQTEEGSWKAMPTALDKPAKKLVVATTHFSDWTIVSSLYLDIYAPVLKPNQKSIIEIAGIRPSEFNGILGAIENDDDVGGTGLEIRNWKLVSGPGTLEVDETGQSRFADYTAPASAAPGTIATIQVELAGLILVSDPKAPDGFRRVSQMILVGDITLRGDTYMIGNFDGTKIMMTDVTALASNGVIYIAAHDQDGRSVELELFGTELRNYPCGKRFSNGKANVYATSTVNPADLYSYISTYRDCGPPETERYTDAAVQLTAWSAVGETVAGKFSGKLYTTDGKDANGCTIYKTRTLNVEFRTLRSL